MARTGFDPPSVPRAQAMDIPGNPGGNSWFILFVKRRTLRKHLARAQQEHHHKCLRCAAESCGGENPCRALPKTRTVSTASLVSMSA